MVSPRSRAYFLLLVVTLIWGIAGPVIRYTVGLIPPFIFLTYRFAIAAITGAVILHFVKTQWPKKLSDWLLIIIYCFLTSTVALALLFLGYEKTSAISGSLINAFYPLLVSAVGALFLREHVTPREKIGLGLAFIGTTIVAIEPFFQNHVVTGDFTGNLYVLASLLVGVALAVMAKLLLRHLRHLALLLTQLSFIVGFLTILPLTLYQYSLSQISISISSAPLSAHLGVIYMALLSGTLAYSLWHQAQKTIEIGETATFTYLYPVITLPLSLFWLHESLSLATLVGAAAITAGVIVAEIKPKQLRPSPHR